MPVSGGTTRKFSKGLLAPAQKRVALLIALRIREAHSAGRLRGAELVHLNGVVDDQIGGNERIGQLRIGAQFVQSVAHGGQIDHAGHAGEILQQDARRAELDFLRARFRIPLGDVFDIARLYCSVVFKAQQIFQQDLDGIGDAREVDAAASSRVRPDERSGSRGC